MFEKQIFTPEYCHFYYSPRVFANLLTVRA